MMGQKAQPNFFVLKHTK